MWVPGYVPIKFIQLPMLANVKRTAETRAQYPTGAVLLFPHAEIIGQLAKLPITPTHVNMYPAMSSGLEMWPWRAITTAHPVVMVAK